jgi:hypothetical protein
MLIFLMLVYLPGARAGSDEEITHLLNYVATTACRYERNGKMYSGPKARDHMQMKYDYFKGKGKVSTAEEFIQYSATRSTMSKKHYRIHCENVAPVNSSDWLMAELKRYRLKETPQNDG